jgi:hypothetical protein
MKKIKFELTEDDDLPFFDKQHYFAEVSLSGDTLEDYLQAFKAFLVVCGFTEDLVSEVVTKEQAIIEWQEENAHLTDYE